jgi:subtilase family serine protease
MVSATCPQCNILLVEATSNSLLNLGTAEQTAVALGANAVSNSYGTSSEFAGETGYDSYYNHPGVAITASSGDAGFGVEWPAASPYVTAVGGTSLYVDTTSPRGWSETAWSGAGSGCSTMEPQPSWQSALGLSGCANRMVADVSAVADPNTGVAVYDTYNSSGWLVFGGTSVAAPIIASVYALAANTATIDASYPYNQTSGLNDITSGSNGTCTPSYLCAAGPGYDGPTGLGTPNGTSAF